jgi:hypothetical protein
LVQFDRLWLKLKIVHKPTFSPDKTPNLLLVAMMAIGASYLDKIHGYEVTQAGAELSNFLYVVLGTFWIFES